MTKSILMLAAALSLNAASIREPRQNPSGGHSIPPDYRFFQVAHRAPGAPVAPLNPDDCCESVSRVPPAETPNAPETPEPGTAVLVIGALAYAARKAARR